MNQGCKGSQAISCLIQIKRKCPCCFHTKLTSSKRHFAAPDLSKARWLLQLIKGKLCLAEQHRGHAGDNHSLAGSVGAKGSSTDSTGKGRWGYTGGTPSKSLSPKEQPQREGIGWKDKGTQWG